MEDSAAPTAGLTAASSPAAATVYPVAEVVVNTPVSRAGGYDAASDIFSYEIPPLWQGQIEPGHLVWVPFSGRRLQGIVVGLAATAPPGVTLRPLAELATPEPVLSPAHLELARWMSQRYLAPLRDCLFVICLLYTSPSPRDRTRSRMPSSA